MTKFAFEVPIAHINDFEPYQDFTFALSVLLTNPKYKCHIQNMCYDAYAYKGPMVYIDNSFNETQLPVTSAYMAKVFNEYHPTAVASPDSDAWGSALIVDEYDTLSNYISATNVLGIFKARDEYDHLVRTDCGHMAVSYWWRNELDFYDATNVHYLGLGNFNEVLERKPRSLDTSIPVKMAIRGYRFDEWVAKGGVYVKAEGVQLRGDYRLQRAWGYFNTVMTDAQVALAIENIQTLKQMVNG